MVLLGWHNTLEKDDGVHRATCRLWTNCLESRRPSPVLWWALEKTKAGDEGHAEPAPSGHMVDAMASMTTCLQKTGNGGKCNMGYDLGCQIVFDDAHDILKECKAWGLEVYAVQKPGLWGLSGLAQEERFDSFPEWMPSWTDTSRWRPQQSWERLSPKVLEKTEPKNPRPWKRPWLLPRAWKSPGGWKRPLVMALAQGLEKPMWSQKRPV